jgi:two-component system, OmpR family, KDP operon response regulator KdpE
MSRVLVVDDEPQIRRALSLNLKARGYEVLEAITGEAALAAVKADHPDIVLLDLGLPDMDGMVVLESLREWSDVAVIVLTVRDDERSKVEALDAGADDYVTKPFDMADLAERIAAAFSRDAAT